MPTAAFTLHAAHRLWRLLPAGPRRRLLTSATARFAPRRDGDPFPLASGVAVVGDLSCRTGIGEGARLMLRGLQHLGIPAYPVDLAAPELPPSRVPLVVHVNAPLLPLALLRLGRSFLRGRRIIGYWAWELPALPSTWRAGLDFVHEIWAPSRFTAAAIETIAPNPVRVVPPPLGLVRPSPAPLDRAAFGLPSDATITLVDFNLASSFVRKNPLDAIAAFRTAFGDRPDQLLLLKIGNPEHFPSDFARIRAAADAPNMRIETRTFPDADHTALVRCSDIVLSLHRSEGLGLIPAEAMLLGRPVVATGWSGNLQFMSAASAALVKYRLVRAHDPRGVYAVRGAQWAEPDLCHAAAQLRRLADDPSLRAALGARGRQEAAERLGIAPLAQAAAAISLTPEQALAA